jgi:hypothetical protein
VDRGPHTPYLVESSALRLLVLQSCVNADSPVGPVSWRQGHTRAESETAIGPERLVRDIRRATRKHYSAEENIRIVLDGLLGVHEKPCSCASSHLFGNRWVERPGELMAGALSRYQVECALQGPTPKLPSYSDLCGQYSAGRRSKEIAQDWIAAYK